MSVSVSPDGKTLAIDLQGGLWRVPVTGGEARRIVDEYHDARQPAWAPDGQQIAFQGYRDGGYDIWVVAPDGSRLRQLTTGPFDDREPAWSHDGSRLAFSSDRGDQRNYNIWILDLRSGALTQLTTNPAEDHTPTWSPDDKEIAFVSTRGGGQSIWAIPVSGGSERQLSPAGTRADAPSWGPDGTLVYHATSPGSSRLEHNGTVLTDTENAFAFRAAWLSPTQFVYVSDGKLRRRLLGDGAATTIPFTAALRITRANYQRVRRDVDSRALRPARGVVRPSISPNGRQVVFAALGDIYVNETTGTARARNLTSDPFFDTDPAWSPDGRHLAWSSDRGGALLDIWIRDMQSGNVRRLTSLPTSAMAPTWSPDGKQIAFLDVDGIWGRATPSVVDVATGTIRKLHDPIFAPGNPTWSPDGQQVLLSVLLPYSTRFREGTNQILALPVTGAGSSDRWIIPSRHLSIDSRVGGGPAWSPDGTRLAVIYEGMLSLIHVAPDGTPLGPPRRVTNDMAHMPSWTADSRQILYQSMDRLRLLDLETGTTRDVSTGVQYAPSIPTGRVIVHAGALVDGVSRTPRHDVDITIVGNRIRSVEPHAASRHQPAATVIDGTGLTVMPGLIEFHSHLQKDFAGGSGRAYLAFGITTVRSPGGSPYEAVEYREAVEAGARPGPRIYSTGYLLEWNRVYYNMAVAVSSPAHLELELQRARTLGHDLIKSYVRMPDLQQRRIIEFAHAAGIPVASHEVYPSSLSGIDGTEHTGATSRRGYSPKQATLQRTYGDVLALFAGTKMPLTPTLALSGAGLRRLIELDPTLRTDPRFDLYPAWLRPADRASLAGPPIDPAASMAMVLHLMRQGAPVVAGTDTPNAANLHAELFTYVQGGMSPYDALQTATVNAARVLGLDAGHIAPGKLADLLLVEGNPLADIRATLQVRRVIANGVVYDPPSLVGSPVRGTR